MEKISNHLSLSEVIKSNTAIKNDISNLPTKEHLENLKLLAEKVFEPIRENFKEPIYIGSGYRSKELNKIIGGASGSQHSKGEALDLDQDFRGTKVTNRMIFDYIKDNLEFDQLILEGGTEENPAWIHVSYKNKGNRNQILRMKNGKYYNYES